MKSSINKIKNYSIILSTTVLVLVFSSPLVYAINYDSNINNADSLIEIQDVELEEIDSTDITLFVPDNSINGIYSSEKNAHVQNLLDKPASTSTLYVDSKYDSFYNNTVFIGDSLTVGFRNYCRSSSNSIATPTTYFIAKESCSAQIALSENALTKYARVMPEFNGSTTYFEDAIAKIPDVQKVFICFGMNDLVGSTPDRYLADVTELVNRIHLQSPDVSIYMISIPCVMSDVNNAGLNNDNIRIANHLMENACKENNWGFVNLSEYLMTDDLSINPSYSSDKYVHENGSAYNIWVQVLRNYAFHSL